jgi:CheY-like chemotaxis protein
MAPSDVEPMKKIVLLVDYDPRSIDAIRRCLAPLGVTLLLATDADAGEREFHRALPDLTLIQDLIPKRRGIDLCRSLKDSPAGQYQPVVLLADIRNGGRRRVIDSGCDTLIEKPFDDGTLVKVVRRFIPEAISFAS